VYPENIPLATDQSNENQNQQLFMFDNWREDSTPRERRYILIAQLRSARY